MKSLLRAIVRRRANGPSHRAPQPSPARLLCLPEIPAALYAVGDVHGCTGLYRNLESRICVDGADYPGRKLIVLLGDIIDRGPGSASMIDHLLEPPPTGFDRLVISGNHEKMFLEFFREPHSNLAWLDFGGLETLASYGLPPDRDVYARSPEHEVRRLLEAHIPPAHIDLLTNLALGIRIDNLFLCHAGMNPDRPLNAQTQQDLLWGDPERLDRSPSRGLMVVHGHTACAEPYLSETRINVDTGAHATGRLSAVRLCKDLSPDILTIGGE